MHRPFAAFRRLLVAKSTQSATFWHLAMPCRFWLLISRSQLSALGVHAVYQSERLDMTRPSISREERCPHPKREVEISWLKEENWVVAVERT